MVQSGKELDKAGLKFLCKEVRAAGTNYGALQFTADCVSKITLHELDKPLTRVIEILRREDNVDPVILTLGAATPGYCDFKRGAEHRKAVIDGLEKLAARNPPSDRAGRKGNRDLYHLVHSLANAWTILTGAAFTQMWVKTWAGDNSPATGGAAFVHAVVRFVDRENLKSVPKMTERVVNDRRKGIVMPWLNVTSGN